MTETTETNAAWTQRYAASLMNTFGPPKMVLARGEGTRVWDVEGHEYLDFLGGIAVNSLGHAHPVFVEAVSRQAGALAHVSNYFATAPQIRLAEKLRELTGAGEEGRVYFANSGTEANEAAFKLARLHAAGGRHRILALQNAFHGRTMGALAMTGKAGTKAFKGTFTIDRFVKSKYTGKLIALGTMKGKLGTKSVTKRNVRIPGKLLTPSGAKPARRNRPLWRPMAWVWARSSCCSTGRRAT